MKKLFVLALALAFGLSCVGLSFAQAPAVKEAPAQTGIKQQEEKAPGSAMPAKPGQAAPPAKSSKVKEAPDQTGIKQQAEQAPGSAAPKAQKKSTKKAAPKKSSKVKEAPDQTGIKQQEEKAQPPVPPVKKGP